MLSDCIRHANAMMDALMVHNDRALDWDNSDTRSSLALNAVNYAAGLDRCDGIASEAVRVAPEFCRLIDGAKASLQLIPKAIANRDADLLHRILIELRSFDTIWRARRHASLSVQFTTCSAERFANASRAYRDGRSSLVFPVTQ